MVLEVEGLSCYEVDEAFHCSEVLDVLDSLASGLFELSIGSCGFDPGWLADTVVDVRKQSYCELGCLNIVKVYDSQVTKYEPLLLLPKQVLTQLLKIPSLFKEHLQLPFNKPQQSLLSERSLMHLSHKPRQKPDIPCQLRRVQLLDLTDPCLHYETLYLLIDIPTKEILPVEMQTQIVHDLVQLVYDMPVMHDGGQVVSVD